MYTYKRATRTIPTCNIHCYAKDKASAKMSTAGTTLRSVSGVPRADLPLAACRHRATQLTQNGRSTLTAEAESFSVFSAETRHGALPRSFRCTIRVWSIPRIEILIKYDVFREKYDTVWHGGIDGNVSRSQMLCQAAGHSYSFRHRHSQLTAETTAWALFCVTADRRSRDEFAKTKTVRTLIRSLKFDSENRS